MPRRKSFVDLIVSFCACETMRKIGWATQPELMMPENPTMGTVIDHKLRHYNVKLGPPPFFNPMFEVIVLISGTGDGWTKGTVWARIIPPSKNTIGTKMSSKSYTTTFVVEYFPDDREFVKLGNFEEADTELAAAVFDKKFRKIIQKIRGSNLFC